MRNLLLLLLLLLTCPTASAQEWIKVTELEGDQYFFDTNSIRKTGDIRRVWTVINYKSKNAKGALSSRGLHEYDCKEERFRVLATSSHGEPMAGGKLIDSWNQVSDWGYIPPGTIAQTMLTFLCAAK